MSRYSLRISFTCLVFAAIVLVGAAAPCAAVDLAGSQGPARLWGAGWSGFSGWAATDWFSSEWWAARLRADHPRAVPKAGGVIGPDGNKRRDTRGQGATAPTRDSRIAM